MFMVPFSRPVALKNGVLYFHQILICFKPYLKAFLVSSLNNNKKVMRYHCVLKVSLSQAKNDENFSNYFYKTQS